MRSGIFLLLMLVITSCEMAPKGVHGNYYNSNCNSLNVNLPVDTILNRLDSGGLTIIGGKINEYDAPWDSLSYWVEFNNCKLEPVKIRLNFNDTTSKSTRLWISQIKGSPTTSYFEYNWRSEQHCNCILSKFREINLIR